jgi:glycerophosphoryl diester phosphodiesterase
MKYRYFFLILLLCSMSMWASVTDTQVKPVKTWQSILRQLQAPSPGSVLVCAHRGDWRHAPENTIEAVGRCIEFGIDIVEIDVRKTKDGQLIVMHDKTVDRTTTGKGSVNKWMLDSLRTLRMRQGNDLAVAGYCVPTLEELMLFVKGKPVIINIDKAWKYMEESYAVLKKTGTVQQAIFKGSATLEELRREHGVLMDSILYMPMVWPMDYNIYGETAAAPDEYVHGFFDDFRPVAFETIFDKEDSPVLTQAFPEIKEAGVTIWVNTLWEELCAGHVDELAIKNPDAHWGWIIRQGANVIQSDRYEELMSYLRNKGLHD